jgi:hypothetical protein
MCPMGSAPSTDELAELARIMSERIMGAASNTEALRQLRAAFPESPLAVRVAALAMLMGRSPGEAAHMPR